MAASASGEAQALKPDFIPADSEMDALTTLKQLAESRVAIEGVWPEIDGGRFPVKQVVGDALSVEADIFADGHDKIDAALLFKPASDAEWRETPMAFFDNDRWRGTFKLEQNTTYLYTVIAWRDLFASCRNEVNKKRAASQSVSLELTEGKLRNQTGC